MQRRWMARFLVLALILVAIPLAAGAPSALQASGTSGSAYAWGANYDGQLGNNSTTDSSVPVVVRLPSGVTVRAIVAGTLHSLAIGSDGTLYAWGYNGYGELGNNSTTDSCVPVEVSLPTGVTPTAIAAGRFHSLASGSDGKLYAWGYNYYGQLGNNSTTDSHFPVVVSLPAGVTATAIAAGDYHSLAILSSRPTAALAGRLHHRHPRLLAHRREPAAQPRADPGAGRQPQLSLCQPSVRKHRSLCPPCHPARWWEHRRRRIVGGGASTRTRPRAIVAECGSVTADHDRARTPFRAQVTPFGDKLRGVRVSWLGHRGLAGLSSPTALGVEPGPYRGQRLRWGMLNPTLLS